MAKHSIDGGKDLIRREFTKQAPLYATNPLIADRDRLTALVRMTEPSPGNKVLEVACGPGYVAMEFATFCKTVVALDITEAQILWGKQLCAQRKIGNVRFGIADAEKLPFRAQEFDVVVSRFAFHHMESPERALKEMARVCKSGGKVVVEDLIASEHHERANYLNRLERLRDPSHVRSLALSELISIFTGAGLEIDRLTLSTLQQDAEKWLANSCSSPETVRQVLALLEEDLRHDLSGLRPSRIEGRLHFEQRTATIVSRKIVN